MLTGALLVVATLAGQATASEAPGKLPDRLLECTLGHATNLDPKRLQRSDEVIYEGRHSFALFLPGIPARTAAPPDATDPAEPVDPRTRIVADPDKLASEASRLFSRVVDYWPERVELTAPIHDPMVQMIIVHPVDPARGTANLFMTRATDLATFDLQRVYQGECQVTTGRDAVAQAQRMTGFGTVRAKNPRVGV